MTRCAPARCRRPLSPSGPTCSSRGRLAPAKRHWCMAARSGIGVTAIQLAHEFGARFSPPPGSTTNARPAATGRRRRDQLPQRGFLAAIKTLTEGRGVDVVLDMVGAPYLARNLRCLAMDGRLVQIAFLQGSKVQGFDFVPVMVRRLTITGSTMRPRTTAQKGAIAPALRENVWPVWKHGRCAAGVHLVSARRGRAGARADGEQRAHRENHADRRIDFHRSHRRGQDLVDIKHCCIVARTTSIALQSGGDGT